MNADVPSRLAYILEDEPTIAALEADLLRDLGYRVVTCSRIVELGDLVELGMPDLFVIDVMLPDGDGGDLSMLLRDLQPGIGMLFVSASGQQRLAELRDLGEVVAKPFDIDEFSDAIKRVEAARASV